MKTVIVGILVSSYLFAEGVTSPKIYQIKGTGDVRLLRKGKVQVANIGDHLENGDVLVTGAENSASLVYSDGSRVILARSTEFTVEPDEKDTPTAVLKSGKGHFLIPKKKEKPKKPRFFIRTNNAVMGVRNTEFIVEVDGRGSQTRLFSFDGTVEVAKSFKAIESGKATHVPEGKFVVADESSVSAPEKFDVFDYRKKFETENPEIESLMNEPGLPIEEPQPHPTISPPMKKRRDR